MLTAFSTRFTPVSTALMMKSLLSSAKDDGGWWNRTSTRPSPIVSSTHIIMVRLGWLNCTTPLPGAGSVTIKVSPTRCTVMCRPFSSSLQNMGHMCFQSSTKCRGME